MVGARLAAADAFGMGPSGAGEVGAGEAREAVADPRAAHQRRIGRAGGDHDVVERDSEALHIALTVQTGPRERPSGIGDADVGHVHPIHPDRDADARGPRHRTLEADDRRAALGQVPMLAGS